MAAACVEPTIPSYLIAGSIAFPLMLMSTGLQLGAFLVDEAPEARRMRIRTGLECLAFAAVAECLFATLCAVESVDPEKYEPWAKARATHVVLIAPLFFVNVCATLWVVHRESARDAESELIAPLMDEELLSENAPKFSGTLLAGQTNV